MAQDDRAVSDLHVMSIEEPSPAYSEVEADRLIRANPRDVKAHLAKADNRMLARDFRAANSFYGHVGRLAGEGETIEKSELLRARDACIWLADRFRDAIIEGLDRQGITSANMHPRFAKSLSIMFGERQRDPVFERFPSLPNMYFYPDLPYLEFANREFFPWCSEIEKQTDAIRQEAIELLEGGVGFSSYVKRAPDRPQGDVHGLLEDPSWSTLELTEKGLPIPERVDTCRKAFDGVQGAPLCDIPNRAPSIMLSLLRSGSHIPPHTGMINTRLICHLPLIVPGEGALRVGSQERVWEEGELLIFDDTVEHEAWNKSNRDRLVLIFDVWHPAISLAEREQIRALFHAVDAD